MALSTDEVLAGLAELINDETGIAADRSTSTSPSRTTSTSTRSR